MDRIVGIEVGEEDPLKGNTSVEDFVAKQTWSLKDYCSKIIHTSQMDLEYNFAQLFYSLFSPTKLYQHTKWRKRTLLHHT